MIATISSVARWRPPRATKDDWSSPGKIWVGEYTGVGPLQITVLKDGLTKNHGYSRLVQDSVMRGLVTCEEGAFEVTPPQTPEGEWVVRQFMDWPISDISAIDIDGDGELEFATIEDFHGPYFRVYKKIDGTFRKIFEHPETSEFYHVVVGATLAGEPVFIGGAAGAASSSCSTCGPSRRRRWNWKPY